LNRIVAVSDYNSKPDSKLALMQQEIDRLKSERAKLLAAELERVKAENVKLLAARADKTKAERVRTLAAELEKVKVENAKLKAESRVRRPHRASQREREFELDVTLYYAPKKLDPNGHELADLAHELMGDDG
jgi:uncharacterized small protein (DUF1192 family)